MSASCAIIFAGALMTSQEIESRILHDLQIPTYNRTSLARLPRVVPKTIDASRS